MILGKYVAYALMSTVEALGVDAVYLFHDPGQIGFRCFHEQVIVIGHQAVGMADAIVVRKGLCQDLKKAVPVAIIEEDGLLGVAPGGQVIKRAGEFDAQGAGHVEQHSR